MGAVVVLRGEQNTPSSERSRHQHPCSTPRRLPSQGDYWSVTFDRHTVRVRDLKGRRYLARLLADPGREYHVLDLVATESGQTAAVGRTPNRECRTRGSAAGPLLDAPAKEAYRRRLGEIEDDIAEALATGDDERAAQATLNATSSAVS